MKIKIGNRMIGDGQPAYFIADIAANHDGDIERAKLLIKLAKDAGADAAKFQNFRANKIVCKEAFDSMGKQLSHQSRWKKSVFEVYQEASIPLDWSKELSDYCRKVGIHYMSTPYDYEAVDMLDKYVPAFKIGSGDITWPDILEYIAKKKKPVILSTGASTIGEVQNAVAVIIKHNKELVLLQCNTNYTASTENFKYINLNVLKTYHAMYPDLILGLSDHTLGPATVLGAIALGAKVIERHFTDDTNREGPDHKFSMDPRTWKDMVDRTRELEYALGDGNKKVEDNEKETVVVQRRALHAASNIKKGEKITEQNIIALRPAKLEAIKPYEKNLILNRSARRDIIKGEHLSRDNIS